MPEPAQAAPSNLTGGAADFGRLIAHLPSWFWTLLVGMGVYTAMSIIIGSQLVPDSLSRAIWCTAQIFVGVFLILGAQFFAMTYLAPKDEKLGLKDIFLPTRLWPLMFHNLPAMRWPVWLVGWGLAIIVSGIIFIGGLAHWMNYLPGTKTAQNNAKTK